MNLTPHYTGSIGMEGAVEPMSSEEVDLEGAKERRSCSVETQASATCA